MSCRSILHCYWGWAQSWATSNRSRISFEADPRRPITAHAAPHVTLNLSYFLSFIDYPPLLIEIAISSRVVWSLSPHVDLSQPVTWRLVPLFSRASCRRAGMTGLWSPHEEWAQDRGRVVSLCPLTLAVCIRDSRSRAWRMTSINRRVIRNRKEQLEERGG